MKLTNDQAKKLIENPPHKHELTSVKRHESALRVFTEDLSEDELVKESYWNELQDTIKKRVASGKFERVCDFIRFPLPVQQLTDSIIGDFNKVFDGKNKYFNIQGDRDLSRLEKWVQNKNLERWIEETASEVFKNKPCSFIVVDRSNNEDPYYFLVDSSRIIDAQEKEGGNGKLEYIAFIHSVTRDETTEKEVKRVAVYDEENYHIFIQSDDGSLTYDEEMSSTHEVGYCPASFFIQETNNSKNLYKRRTAFSSSISKLEDWTIFDIFRNYVDHYAPFPVTESVVKKCGNPQCEDGAVKIEETILEGPDKGTQRTKFTKCEVCDGEGRGKAYVGPGTHINLKWQPNKQLEDGSGKFRMIFPDVDKLEYTPKKLDDLELEIRFKTVGINNMLSKEAVNELQAKGSFASMETVLLRNKTVLDNVFVFIVETAGRLLYKNLKAEIEANHGTEWYLTSEEDLQARFKEAKAIGLPINEVTSIYHQIIETKYASNKSKRDREIMLIDLQEFPFYSLEECTTLKNEGVIDSFQLSMKANFYNFVQRFERENGEITHFGSLLEYEKRVDIIKLELERFSEEAMEKAKTRLNKIENPSNNEND